MEQLSLYFTCGSTILAAILVFLLPETTELELPDTVEEVEMQPTRRHQSEWFSLQLFK